ncbi:anaerobic glycerol-3-phosphate dehydrogenase subunit A [Desulfoluna sp.]|uniref:anaerobic glycerol-3-phosphate dehydrogenase subunit A n=1 Tax=Desulfoluna sp. TaxID=2045199 RepID=UPI0026058DC9|nr:anaerobic glycerol-3-phosphate dehydrogenase subunit A [Desulfoluna sp.]
MKRMKADVTVIGAGATGCGVARDLALRGLSVLIVERGDINSGASGGNHGLLHSGARYLLTDRDSAEECQDENILLREMAPQCIEATGGLFVGVEGDNENDMEDFEGLLSQSRIPHRQMDVAEARALEPSLSTHLITAYEVNDATVDPFRLSLDNVADALSHGAELLCGTAFVGVKRQGPRVTHAVLQRRSTGETLEVETTCVVNAAGAWAGYVAAIAGAKTPVRCSKGTLVVTDHRMTRCVVNRLRRPSDADIVVPGGTVSIVGTTSTPVENPDVAWPTSAEVDRIVEEASALIPRLASTRMIRAYSGVRPLFGASGGGDDRTVSRGFRLMDHGAEGVENVFTITGGKLTTYRLMAERAADAVCHYLGTGGPCVTRTRPLPVSSGALWTEPGAAPKKWMSGHQAGDGMICECEMVSESVISSLVASLKQQGLATGLAEVGLRSRVGKGACQGSFCGLRLAAWMYGQGHLTQDAGISGLRRFYKERWKGMRPVSWGDNLARAELHEALQCGLFGMEVEHD